MWFGEVLEAVKHPRTTGSKVQSKVQGKHSSLQVLKQRMKFSGRIPVSGKRFTNGNDPLHDGLLERTLHLH